jgi:hypothetical protein
MDETLVPDFGSHSLGLLNHFRIGVQSQFFHGGLTTYNGKNFVRTTSVRVETTRSNSLAEHGS